jgi:hypothetical protein
MAGLLLRRARRRWVEVDEGLISQLPDPPQQMRSRDALLDQDVEEQGAAELLLTSHLRGAGQ